MKAKWWGVLVWICIGLYFGTLFSNISVINKSIGDEGDEVTPKADYEKKGRRGETRNVKYKYERERQGVRLSDTTTFSSAGCACKQMDIFQILPSKGKLIFAHVPKTAGTSIEHILSIGGSCHATAFELRECNPELLIQRSPSPSFVTHSNGWYRCMATRRREGMDQNPIRKSLLG